MKVVALAMVVLTGGLGAASSAVADETTCAGVITGRHDNVVVPAGESCSIFGAEISGHVRARENTRLTIVDSTVRGNVEGDRADIVQVITLGGTSVVGGHIDARQGSSFVRVCGTQMPSGNIQVTKYGPNAFVFLGGAFCEGAGGGNTVLRGNIKVEDNVIGEFAPFGLDIAENSFGNTLQVSRNVGPGAKRVQGNTVGTVLQCRDNSPPFVGGPNVAPRKDGQCF